jgi:murein DD-endopeptidase MepM/ murein hydrolase activator NlpD
MLAVVAINVLIKDVEKLQDKNIIIEDDYENLLAKNKSMDQKIKEFDRIDGDIKDVEYLLGIRSTKAIDYDNRIDLVKVNTLERKRMLEIIPSGYPLLFHGVTGRYGARIHPILATSEFHPGIDLRAKMRTKIFSTANGIVKYVGGNKKGYGKLIVIDHGYGFTTYYGHLYKFKVKIGDIIGKNQLIALSGNSGLSNGPHLHYEIRFLNKTLNPFHFMKWSIKHYEAIFKKEKRIPWQYLKKLMRKQVALQEQQ